MVRCMRCGASVEGYAQMCDNCAAQKREADLASMQQAGETSTMGCPWCGATMLRSAQRCSSCFRDWADYRAPVVGMGGVSAANYGALDRWIIDTSSEHRDGRGDCHAPARPSAGARLA